MHLREKIIKISSHNNVVMQCINEMANGHVPCSSPEHYSEMRVTDYNMTEAVKKWGIKVLVVALYLGSIPNQGNVSLKLLKQSYNLKYDSWRHLEHTL